MLRKPKRCLAKKNITSEVINFLASLSLQKTNYNQSQFKSITVIKGNSDKVLGIFVFGEICGF